MTQQFDPWTNGTPGYRRALVTGMAGTFLGVLALLAAVFVTGTEFQDLLRRAGMVLVGLGILIHLLSILLRRRQAKEIIQERARKDG